MNEIIQLNEIIQFIFSLFTLNDKDPVGGSIVWLIFRVFWVGVINYLLHIVWLRIWERHNLKQVRDYIKANHGLGDISPQLLNRLSAAKVSKFSIIYRRIHDLVQIKQNSGQIDNDALADIHTGEASRKAALSSYILGILIILGLIGTLRGLITAIIEVQPLLQDIQDLDQLPTISDALRETLAGMNTAFVTTLAGLLTSLGLGFCGWIFNRENSAFLTDFERFVSTEIIPHFTQAPEASIASAVEQLTKCTDTLEMATRENVQAMHQAIQLLTDTSWGGHLEQQYILADNFGRTSESLLKSLSGINEYQFLITSAVEKFEGLTTQSMSQITEYQGVLRQGLEDSVPKLEEESKSLKTTIADYQASQATFIDELGSELKRQLQPITENQEEIASVLSQTAESLLSSLAKINEYQDHITSAVEGFNEVTMESTSRIAEYQDVLRRGLEDAVPKLAAESRTLKNAIDEYQNSQSRFVDELSSTLQEHLQSVTENQQEMIHVLIDELSNTLDPYNELNAQLVSQIREYQGTVQRGLENSLSRFTAESQTLKTAIGEYRESQSTFIDELSDALHAKLRPITESQQGMVHVLTRLSDELQIRSALETQNQVFGRIENRMDRYGERVDQQNELIQTLVTTVQDLLQKPSLEPTNRDGSSQQISPQSGQQISLRFDALNEKIDTLNNTMRQPGIYRWVWVIRGWFRGTR